MTVVQPRRAPRHRQLRQGLLLELRQPGRHAADRRRQGRADADEATDLLKQAARQISEDSPVDWLFLGADLTASKADVTGYPINDTASRFDASGHRRRLMRPSDSMNRRPAALAARTRAAMTLFVLRRLGLLVVALFLTSIVIFLLLRLLPGDLARVLGGTEASPERIEALRAELGLNRSLVEQYLDWIGGILPRRLRALGAQRQVGARRAHEKLTVTAPLVLVSTVAAAVVAVPLGIVAAARHRKRRRCRAERRQPARHRRAVVLGRAAARGRRVGELGPPAGPGLPDRRLGRSRPSAPSRSRCP